MAMEGTGPVGFIPGQIAPLRDIIQNIVEHFEQRHVETAKSLYKDILHDDYDQIHSAHQFFDALEKKARTQEDFIESVKNLMDHLNFHMEHGVVRAYDRLIQYQTDKVKHERRMREQGLFFDKNFVGRTEVILQINDYLFNENSKLEAVNICGMGGIGKSNLAALICMSNQLSWDVKKVNLREREVLVDVLNALITDLKFPIIPPNDTEDKKMRLTEELKKIKRKTLVFIDDTDAVMFGPDGKDFISLMDELLKKKENNMVKFVMTSRAKMIAPDERSQGMDVKHCCRTHGILAEIELGPLHIKDAMELLKKYSGEAVMTEEEKRIIAESCNCHPLMLKGIANSIQGIISPSEIIKQLERGISHSVDPERRVSATLRQWFSYLADDVKDTVIQLSVFVDWFDIPAAKRVLEEDETTTKIHLESLKWMHLVEVQDVKEENRDCDVLQGSKVFSLHPMIKSFAQQLGKTSEKHDLSQESLRRYLEHYNDLWTESAKTVERNPVRSLQKMSVNKAHYHKLLSHMNSFSFHSKNLGIEGLKLGFNKFSFMEMFVYDHTRERFFREQAELALKDNDLYNYIQLKLYEAEQVFIKDRYQMAAPILQELQEPLVNVRNEQGADSDVYRLLTAHYNYIKGRMLNRDRLFIASEPLLRESASIFQSILGDDIYTARSLNSLGKTQLLTKQWDLAYATYEKAYNMIRNKYGEVYFDVPVYAMNIGTCYHEHGNFHYYNDREQEMDKAYTQALFWYDKSIDLEKRLSMYGYESTAQKLKNKATLLYDLGRYDEALPAAKEAYLIRKRCFPGAHRFKTKSAIYLASIVRAIADEKSNEDAESWYSEAEKYYEDALVMAERGGLPPADSDFGCLKEEYMDVLRKLGKRSKAFRVQNRIKNIERRRESRESTTRREAQRQFSSTSTTSELGSSFESSFEEMIEDVDPDSGSDRSRESSPIVRGGSEHQTLTSASTSHNTQSEDEGETPAKKSKNSDDIS